MAEPAQDKLTRHGLAAFAGLFPKYDPAKIKEALGVLEAELGQLEKTQPERALKIARAVRQLTEVVDAK